MAHCARGHTAATRQLWCISCPQTKLVGTADHGIRHRTHLKTESPCSAIVNGSKEAMSETGTIQDTHLYNIHNSGAADASSRLSCDKMALQGQSDYKQGEAMHAMQSIDVNCSVQLVYTVIMNIGQSRCKLPVKTTR